jgi:hypothetical protein
MGFTAIGFETESGEVNYVLWPEACNLDDLEEIIKDRTYPEGMDPTENCSLDKYFTYDMDTYEDTRWRILFMLDGTTQCRLFSMDGIFVYRQVPAVLGQQM